VSKGIVISASHYAFEKGPVVVGDFYTLELLLLIGGVGTFMSFIKFGYYAFFHGSYDGSVKDANRGQSVAMVSVAALCVFYGVFDGALFALLPFDVTSDAVVAHVYHTYTVDHVREGVILAVLGLLGFALVKKPLSGLGRVPDVDDVHNPLTFHGTRYLVVGVTELYAAVDRVVVAAAGATASAVRAPGAVAGRVTGSDDGPVSLRADYSTSVLLVAVVLAVLVAASVSL
jgi:multicomponent Na+:H+ antiporter subunit D